MISLPAPSGLSHRDWLAGLAMGGLMCNPAYSSAPPAQVAALAYEQADFMLAYSEEPPMDVAMGDDVLEDE